ncbi:MAG: HAD hydrolase-like protein [Proteobacteria bacterium]|nr:HAD hydrolase-like protein [Pseudomonadota bacterium]
MNLLVDLDGTITDPARGMLTAMRQGMAAVGLKAPDDMRWMIGPPLRQSLASLGATPEGAERALAVYREHYRAGGMYEADLIEGMDAVLRHLKGQGHRLFVATSKPHVYARPIIAHFGLTDVFEAVHGSELDGRNDHKHEVIADILTTHDLAADDCIMIGDTRFDVDGARHHGIPCIGVDWGHGGELLAASGPAIIVTQARDLAGAVARLVADVAEKGRLS